MEFINDKLNEFNRYLQGRRVAIIGLGVSNIPLLDYMYQNNANVTVFDNKSIDKIPKEVMDKITEYNMEFSFGENYLSKLKNFDLIFRAPSCLPTIKELALEEEQGAIVTSEIEMLMKMCPCKIIGITGSDGKTTTTTLIHRILLKAGYNTYLGGNIGIPLFTKLKDIRPEDIVVLELSSFQLMGMDISPDISVITNITPNHLNIHSSYEEYIDAKKNIFKYQNEDGILILNYDNEITRSCKNEANGKVRYFSSVEKLDDGFIVDNGVIKECEDKIRRHIITVNDLVLRGEHNFQNVCTALAATKDLVNVEDAINAIKDFPGVEHRCEFVRELNGVKWYNDSSSSSPTRTVAGLNSFSENIILIAGGYDKNLDYKPIAKPVLDKVKAVILIGQTSEKIFDVIKEESERQNKKIDIYMCDELKQTVSIANKIANNGDIVLFSPASASFDMFKNFADRGNQFKKLVEEI